MYDLLPRDKLKILELCYQYNISKAARTQIERLIVDFQKEAIESYIKESSKISKE